MKPRRGRPSPARMAPIALAAAVAGVLATGGLLLWLTFDELSAPRLNRFRAPSAAPEHLESYMHRRFVAELSTCNAALCGISSGYAGAYPLAHPVTAVLRTLEASLDALRAELAKYSVVAGPAPSVGRAADLRVPRTVMTPGFSPSPWPAPAREP
jgi:hypothetical protein